MCKSGENQTGRERETHSLLGHTPARIRLKSRRSFLTSVQPVHFPAKVVGVNKWERRLEEKTHAGLVNMYEDLVTGNYSPWLNLNRLRTGYTCSQEQSKKWEYFNGDTTCECGLAAESTFHMLRCSLLAHPCTLDDLLEFNDTAQACTCRAMEEDSLMTRYDDDCYIYIQQVLVFSIKHQTNVNKFPNCFFFILCLLQLSYVDVCIDWKYQVYTQYYSYYN